MVAALEPMLGELAGATGDGAVARMPLFAVLSAEIEYSAVRALGTCRTFATRPALVRWPA